MATEAAEDELVAPATVACYLQVPSLQRLASYASLTPGPVGTDEEQSKELHHPLETPDVSHISDTPGLGCVGTGRYPSSPHSCLPLPFLVRACLPENPTTVVPHPRPRGGGGGHLTTHISLWQPLPWTRGTRWKEDKSTLQPMYTNSMRQEIQPKGETPRPGGRHSPMEQVPEQLPSGQKPTVISLEF